MANICLRILEFADAITARNSSVAPYPLYLRYHEMKMQKLQPSTDTLNSLIEACGKAGQLERAWTIFEYQKRL